MEATRQVRGVVVPSLMYGTAWKEERTEALAGRAIACGFRAIDTANQRKHYFEAGVGSAVRAALAGGQLQRSDLFLQTKYTYQRGQDARLPYDPKADLPTQVAQSIHSSLEHLGVARIDSYVLHGPSRGYGLGDDDWQVWRAMEQAARDDTVGLLGVSNVSFEQLSALLDGAEIAPAFVQNRCFARDGWDEEIRALCRARDIVYQGFSLLTANGRELSAPKVAAIARRHHKTIPQVVFRFALQLGMLPLTGTSDEQHMREDLALFDFELDDAEMETLLHVGLR
jgi:diketogulonate reductase-like aldo/keto reductase